MRRLLVVVLLLFVATAASAQTAHGSNASNDVAQGSEKEAHKTAHPDESQAEPGHAPKTYFGIPGWILKIANMILFIGVLGYFIGGPVKKAFAERNAAIRRAADEARERHAKADQMAGDIQARLTQIEEEVRSIRQRAEVEGERQKRELIAAAEAEAAKIVQTARSEVDSRLKLARHELTEFAGQLAAERAEGILREQINEADQRKLFQESLRQVGEVRS